MAFFHVSGLGWRAVYLSDKHILVALRAVVCTSTLDLGIDWGAVDLVIQVGAPKGLSRLVQRIGRANHRLDEPSRALLVPANRLEGLEGEPLAVKSYAGDPMVRIKPPSNPVSF